jgi:entericidin A
MKKQLFVLLMSVVVLTACNTMQGIGKDVKKAGEVVETAAKK